MQEWMKPAIQGQQQGFLHAGVAESLFPPDGIIAVGFGCATLTKSGALIYAEDEAIDGEYMTGAQAEEAAAKDPDHDWRISLWGALSGREYQRHGENRWVLIEQSQGFA